MLTTVEHHKTEATRLAGRYRLEECVGQGGMARVYRAVDEHLGRTVAVKVMSDDAELPEARQRSQNEMRVLASLNHPSLVKLLDARVGVGSGVGHETYLVMEYVAGETLAARLQRGPLAAGEVRHLAVQLATALHAVHAGGVVHRDLKPSNVLLAPALAPDRYPDVKVADFGVAQLVDASRITAVGTVVGTAAYLAPEQVRGDAATPAADVYALGLVLIECLTGARAYGHSTGIAAVMARLIDPPVIPESVGPGWARLLTRMTAMDPLARPTPAEVASVAATIADHSVDAVGSSSPRTQPCAQISAPTLAVEVPAPAAPLASGDAAPADPRHEAPATRATRRRSRRPVRSRRVPVLAGGSALAAGVAVAFLVFGSAAPAANTVPLSEHRFATTPPASTSIAPPEEVTVDAPAPDTAGNAVDGAVTPSVTKSERASEKAADRAARDAAKEERKVAQEQRTAAKKDAKRGNG